MYSQTVAVGKEALSYCSSCKMDLNHTIAAMDGSRIIRVMCRTCKKEHTYRAPKGITSPDQQPPEKTSTRSAPSGSKSRSSGDGYTSSKKEVVSFEVEWNEKLRVALQKTSSKTYSVKSHFVQGDVIKHPQFGEGVVEKAVYPNKIEVFFRHEIKTLIHSPTASK